MGHICLQNFLTEVFSNFRLNNNFVLFDNHGIDTLAVIRISEESFNIFDAQMMTRFAWDGMGCPIHLGNAFSCCLPLEKLKALYHSSSCSFEIKGAFVRDSELDLQNVHETPKIVHLPFSDKRNQTQPIKRKQKPYTETLEEKEKRLPARREYEKGRMRQMKVKNLRKRG